MSQLKKKPSRQDLFELVNGITLLKSLPRLQKTALDLRLRFLPEGKIEEVYKFFKTEKDFIENLYKKTAEKAERAVEAYNRVIDGMTKYIRNYSTKK